MTHGPRSHCIALYRTGPRTVGNILGSGLALQQPRGASSKLSRQLRAISDKYRALSNAYPACGLAVYVTGDGADVYQDELFELAEASNNAFRPVLILVGIRLGIDRVTPAYWEALASSLKLPQSVGIAGYEGLCHRL